MCLHDGIAKNHLFFPNMLWSSEVNLNLMTSKTLYLCINMGFLSSMHKYGWGLDTMGAHTFETQGNDRKESPLISMLQYLSLGTINQALIA